MTIFLPNVGIKGNVSSQKFKHLFLWSEGLTPLLKTHVSKLP